MAMAFGEWHRAHPGETRADWEDYLHRLATAAELAMDPGDATARTPEEALAKALRGHDDGLGTTSMITSVLATLADAGYAITDVSADGPGHYTREQVCAAVNGAAGLLPEHEGESEETIARDDTVNLVVNAALYLLDHPGAGADEVIAAQYTDVEIYEDDLDEDEEMPERGSPRWNELVVARVLGWVES
jgi:hypothetical protein